MHKKIVTVIVLSIVVSSLFGYFFGYLHHLYITRDPIKLVGELNPGNRK